ncbi:hypothetical protein LYNGBM3L_49660, partial [Moorena producens 3L]
AAVSRAGTKTYAPESDKSNLERLFTLGDTRKCIKKGGQAAVAAVKDHISKDKGAIVGGDFNYPINSVGSVAKHPYSWQTTPPAQVSLNFTQWNKIDGNTKGPDPNLHIVKTGTVIYKKIDPHNVIDYVMKGANRTVNSLPNCENPTAETRWIEILREFDHCPVVYNIT